MGPFLNVKMTKPNGINSIDKHKQNLFLRNNTILLSSTKSNVLETTHLRKIILYKGVQDSGLSTFTNFMVMVIISPSVDRVEVSTVSCKGKNNVIIIVIYE